MVYSTVKKVIMFVPNKINSINTNIDKIIELPEKTDKFFTYVTKVTGATTGAAKCSVDLAEAIACKDGICAVVSDVGVAADSLQICASFVPGPNVTSVVTTPISVSSKVFVWCCKKSKLPWGGC